ncbi:MAG: nicotinate-nucleotide pyrophosphorylase, partial [Kiritimatiellae bacterium]|nr:nicotinate-nucleotide pyrophosphorylase [Kiritimatiellia bacterium]
MTDVMKSPRARAAVQLALDEDLGDVVKTSFRRRCDATSEALVDVAAKATGEIYSRVPCVVAGATVAAAVLKAVDPRVKVKILRPDGSFVKPNETILEFSGHARSILAAERTALNFMQRMCATATLTKKFVDATKKYGT